MEIKHKQFNTSLEFQVFTYLLLAGTLVTLFVGYIGSKQAQSIRNSKTFYGTVIKADDNIKYVSDSSFYFVGNTRNYLFMYNEKENKTTILPMSKVKEIVIHLNELKK